MHNYRLYSLSPTAMIVCWKDRCCDDDESALEDAIDMRQYIEIWCGRRIVKRIDRGGQIVVGLPAIFSPHDGLRE